MISPCKTAKNLIRGEAALRPEIVTWCLRERAILIYTKRLLSPLEPILTRFHPHNRYFWKFIKILFFANDFKKISFWPALQDFPLNSRPQGADGQPKSSSAQGSVHAFPIVDFAFWLLNRLGFVSCGVGPSFLAGNRSIGWIDALKTDLCCDSIVEKGYEE